MLGQIGHCVFCDHPITVTPTLKERGQTRQECRSLFVTPRPEGDMCRECMILDRSESARRAMRNAVDLAKEKRVV